RVRHVARDDRGAAGRARAARPVAACRRLRRGLQRVPGRAFLRAGGTGPRMEPDGLRPPLRQPLMRAAPFALASWLLPSGAVLITYWISVSSGEVPTCI